MSMAVTANMHAGNGSDRSSGSVCPVRVFSLPVAVSLLAHASLFAAAFVWWQGEGASAPKGLPQGQSVMFVSLVPQASAKAANAVPFVEPEKSLAKPESVEMPKVESVASPKPVKQKHAEPIKRQLAEKQEVARLSQASDMSQVSDASPATGAASSDASAQAVGATALKGQANGSAGIRDGESDETPFVEPHFRVRPQPPTYPRRARRLEQEGEALIRVKLDPRGNAAEVLVWKSSGFALLDDAALTAVRHWKFVPAERSGKPIIAWVEIPVRFALN